MSIPSGKDRVRVRGEEPSLKHILTFTKSHKKYGDKIYINSSEFSLTFTLIGPGEIEWFCLDTHTCEGVK